MKYRRRKFIQERINQILEDSKITQPPVNVKAIAKKHNINLVLHDFGDEVSGVLIIKDSIPTIGYNPNHSLVRQRFTIAHELGHFFLNHQRDGLFVDKPKNDFAVFFRNNKSSLGEYEQEIEANAFAAELLMPKSMVIEKVKQYGLELSDENIENDEAVKKMANVFKVSKQAMSFRIGSIFSTY